MIKKSINYLKSMFCNQKDFYIFICGGFNLRRRAVSGVNNLDNLTAIPPMNTEQHSLKVVNLKDKLYVFEVRDNSRYWVMSIIKYSSDSKKWSNVADLYDCVRFCVCAIMDKMFIIGGRITCVITEACSQFDTSDCTWKEIANMNQARLLAACVFFEEKVIVSGGYNNVFRKTNFAESYDAYQIDNLQCLI